MQVPRHAAARHGLGRAGHARRRLRHCCRGDADGHFARRCLSARARRRPDGFRERVGLRGSGMFTPWRERGLATIGVLFVVLLLGRSLWTCLGSLSLGPWLRGSANAVGDTGHNTPHLGLSGNWRSWSSGPLFYSALLAAGRLPVPVARRVGWRRRVRRTSMTWAVLGLEEAHGLLVSYMQLRD